MGGYCSSFTRKGFRFDAASHFYPLLGNPSTITGKLLKDLDVNTEWVKMDPVDHFHFPDGTRWSVPAELDRYLPQLKSTFPEESEAIDAFYAEAKKLYLLGLLTYFRDGDTARLGKFKNETLREAIDRYFRDPALKLLLTADCPHWGSPPSRVSFVFDSMLRLSNFLGNYYPKGGSQVFADDLARRIEANGGDVILRSHVRRILHEDGNVTGLEIEMGSPKRRRLTKVTSPVVVSNADMQQTARKLLGDSICRESLNRMAKLRKSAPCYLMHIGLRDTSTDEMERIQGYYWNEWDANHQGTTALRYKLFVPTLFDPSVAPEGSHIVIVQKVIEPLDDQPMDAAHKERVDQFVLGHLEETLPNFHERVVVRLSASAWTSYRYTLNDEGAMLGWEMSPDQLGEHRPDIRGPLKGLYYTGHWTRPGGGITPVIVSAMKVAAAVKEDSTH